MVTQKDILLGLNLKLAIAFPQHTIYVQECPKDFKRPSFLLEYVSTSRKDATRNTIAKTAYFTLACFTPVDKYSRSDMDELSGLQEDTMQLFSDGYVMVGDRAVKVQSSTGGMDLDRAFIDLQFEYFDARTEAADTNPLIASVQTNLQEG